MRYAADTRLIWLHKDGHDYLFVFTEQTKGDLLRKLGRYASIGWCGFEWRDVAWVSKQITEDTIQRLG